MHAEFHQAKIDYHHKGAQTGGYKLIDGEPKAWDLEFCLKRRYPNSSDPVRLNAELFVALRNKVGHRYEHNAKVATGGKAQALFMNYEHEMVSHFGGAFSLACSWVSPLRSMNSSMSSALPLVAWRPELEG
ncbi:DUF3644 domain-containing protein [Salinispora pacifica]|uniref:DUF3644 domain-containing protein n=1 Tax=Salinispora pacifica TaxID=351187 RepID=UPI00036A7332|nr:DUF3644 domain-containing protein [Salinispora pacifica]